MSEQSNTKRLAKNTLFMYFRMGLLMLISLYTSRVILKQLGVDDYGIYNVVGSIVIMFISLKSIFASSTQRFLSYEMGKGDYSKLQLIYNMSTIINALIAIVFIVIVEAVGLWFLNFKINIDPSRLDAAHWVFQFSVVSTVVSIMSTPLDACVIAHERMDFYAYLSIFEGLARLGICYLLSVFDVDKLILYGFLTMSVTFIVRIINQIFCMKEFDECHLKLCWDKPYFIKMTSFAGWAFFGNTSNMLSQSGLNLVLNIFGGPAVNAARGISYQVSNSISQLLSNITIVLKPYAIKTYASGDINKALNITFISSRLYFVIQLLITIVISFFATDILRLWLGEVPEYTALFLDLVLIQSVIRSLHMPIDFLFCGEGNIKYYQIIEGIVLALPIPLSYVLLNLGLPYYYAFLALIACEILHIASISTLASRICKLDLGCYFKTVILPCMICGFVYMIVFHRVYTLQPSVIENIILSLITSIAIVIVMLMIGFSKEDRNLILSLIKKKNNETA